MTHRDKWIIALSAIWAAGLLVWPRPTNLASDSVVPLSRREGLYKSTLTEANLGLLGVRFYESFEGKKRWKIESEFAELHRSENLAFMRGVNALFFVASSGNEVVTVSDFGRSFMDKHEIELYGNVAIRSKQGYEFTMEKLNYFSETHSFQTTDVVKMRGPDVESPTMFLEGVGLNADLDEERFVLKKDIVASRQLRSSQWMYIKSQKGEFNTGTGQAKFQKRVRATMPDMVIQSEELELLLKKGDDDVIDVRQAVRINHKDKVAKADMAHIELGTDRIILKGRASVVNQGNELRGEQIIIHTDDDRIEVEQAQGRISQ